MSEGQFELPMGGRTKPSPQRTTACPISQFHWQTSESPEYNNPDPVVQLIGPPNEAKVEVNGVATYTLIDIGSQITMITCSFVRQLQLNVHDFNEVTQVDGTWGLTVPYLGYVEINLRIPQFPQYEETFLMLVILDSWYMYGIQIEIGTWVIWKVMWMVNEQNFNKLMEAWRNTYVSTNTVGQLALSETTEDVFNQSVVKGWSPPPRRSL